MTNQEKTQIIAKLEGLIAKNLAAGKSTTLLQYMVDEAKAGSLTAPKRMI